MLMTQADQSDNQSLQDLLTIEEAMAFSGYTGQYLRKMAGKGMIRAMKKGHFWLIDQESLRNYMEAAIENEDRRFGPREEDE